MSGAGATAWRGRIAAAQPTPAEPEPALGPSDQGAVVLDIGESTGALVVHTTDALCDLEIEIRSVGSPWDGTHTAVRPRPHGAAVRYAAVFPSLVADAYEIRVRHHDPAPTQAVAVAAAGVTEIVFAPT